MRALTASEVSLDGGLGGPLRCLLGDFYRFAVLIWQLRLEDGILKPQVHLFGVLSFVIGVISDEEGSVLSLLGC